MKSERTAIGIVLVAIGVMAFVSGCVGVFTQQAIPPRRATAEELASLLRQREMAISSLKGLFTAKVRGGWFPIASRVEGAVYYRRPHAMRLRGFTPMGSELFEFIQTDDFYLLRLPTMGRLLRGRSSEFLSGEFSSGLKEEQSLARPVQLSAWAVGGILGTGMITSEETVRVEEEGDRYRLEVYAGKRNNSGDTRPVRRLWFDRRTLLVVQEDRLGRSGEIDATIHYEDFRPVGVAVRRGIDLETDGVLIRPFKIVLEDGQGQGSIQITFHEILPNQPIRTEELGEAL
ncbi:MAG: outer membrane lipoprotein-sorting protein [Nitrospira sp.]|nr:outer membrane lipoprotein-sorting protein [Nitrospira sp.]MCP9465587.1 outer membrane lipoprotein-sorting protein [Nitrospira sp.]